MRPVWVVDAAVVTALGADVETLWAELLAGRTGIRAVERFPIRSYGSRVAALVADLSAAPGRSLVHDLLERLLSRLAPLPADAELLTASTKGGIDCLEPLARGELAERSDLLFPSLLDEVSSRLGLGGEAANVNAACASSTIALARAAGRIACGTAEEVLVVGFDLVTEFVFSGFSALKALSTEPCRPFDRGRTGLSLGEGAVALRLTSEERARRDGRPCLGTIAGWGVANDATHITAPARDGSGLILAVRRALAVAGIGPEAVAAVSAHGTGTVYNDAMELVAFREVFGDRPVPVHSLKGALGHTMGAAGGLEAVVCLKALREQRAPPTAGLRDPEPAAQGQVAAEAVPFSGSFLLSTNSGFGGINAALVLGHRGAA
ncbi:MAG: beta-ketoacyl-[acyl-carrier-protein] synthase family protein [Deltaproteobacteria bacterium]|nr:beta-ketoacyl-[acyl-carrier-protein] synthase family protein [Deltaproteobacteria bacterium]